MSLSFQIALLGSEHNYVASLMKILPSTCPLKAAETTFFRLPKKFQDDFDNLAKARNYMYDIHGHDFLSHSGQCTNKRFEITALQQSTVIWAETDELRKIAVLDAQKFRGTTSEVIASFGPASGSFFADAPRLRRYEWANLPRTLEVCLKELICMNGYGDKRTKIQSVAINSNGGWVLQGGKDHLVQWGGDLPLELVNVLKTLGRRRPHIETLVLNHQHPTEYVLVLDDGQVYCRLHSAFEKQLHPMLEKWANDHRVSLQWKYENSCGCLEEVQSSRDALYYHRRGWFHLERGIKLHQGTNLEVAYVYFREAHTKDPWNPHIRQAYARSLIALRPFRKDPILETHLARDGPRAPLPAGSDVNAEFRHQYDEMRETIDLVQRSPIAFPKPLREWSLKEEVRSVDDEVFELDLSPVSEAVAELATAQWKIYG